MICVKLEENTHHIKCKKYKDEIEKIKGEPLNKVLQNSSDKKRNLHGKRNTRSSYRSQQICI